ncbi:hypothetical protein K270103H11_03840 [Gordonibacter urolithinfaciens]
MASSTNAEFPTSYRTQLRSCLVNFARAMVRLPLVPRAPARLATAVQLETFFTTGKPTVNKHRLIVYDSAKRHG